MKNIVKILIGCILIYSIRGNVVFLVDFVFVYDFFDQFVLIDVFQDIRGLYQYFNCIIDGDDKKYVQ